MSHEFHQRMDRCLAAICPPRFPARRALITAFGARADSHTVQTAHIQRGIDALHADGGGTLVVPAGRFLTGALRLRSNICLHLEDPDSTLLFTTEMTEQHYPVVFSHWEASPCYNYSALLYALEEENIAVTGCGTLDAQADAENWWSWHHQVENAWSSDKQDLQQPARVALRNMNEQGVPVAERRFGDGHFLRPNFIQLIRCKNILLEGVTLKHSPMWQLNPVFCDNITIRGMTLFAHGPNSDGCDPESCSNVLIEHNRFQTGDDCISLKSGRDRDGRLTATPCQNIVIRHNFFLDGHGGIAMGSEMSGGIQNVYADQNRFESPNLTYLLRFKTNAKRGGFIRNVWLYNTVATAVNGAAIHATMLYEDGPKGDFIPTFEEIHIENLDACGGDYGIFLEAFAQSPIRGLVLKNIRIRDVTTPLRATNWQAPQIDGVEINRLSYPRPMLTHIKGMPSPGETVTACAELLGGDPTKLRYTWLLDAVEVAQSSSFTLPPDSVGKALCLSAQTDADRKCISRPYLVLAQSEAPSGIRRLQTRGILPLDFTAPPPRPITRIELATLLNPFCIGVATPTTCPDLDPSNEAHLVAQKVVGHRLMNTVEGVFRPDATISREELASVAMQSCGVSYKNASSTMPDCTDLADVAYQYGTNVARSIYWGFLSCDKAGNFHPKRPASWDETIGMLERIADFAAF